MRIFVILLCLFALLSAFAEKQPFERYQSIVDRQMFGPLPPGFDPNKLPSEVQKPSMSNKELTKEQERLQSAVHFCAINVMPDGTPQVGFTDNSNPKEPHHHLLKVGETEDGWTVKEADASTSSMTIVKDDIEVSLTLGGDSSKGAGKTAAAGRGADERGLLGGVTLRSRRQARREAEAAEAQKAAADAAAREAQRQAKEEADKAQREAERAEQRQQLLAIQEELRRVREEKAKSDSAKQEADNGSGEEE